MCVMCFYALSNQSENIVSGHPNKCFVFDTLLLSQQKVQLLPITLVNELAYTYLYYAHVLKIYIWQKDIQRG